MGTAQRLSTEQNELLAELLDRDASPPERTTDLLAKRLTTGPGREAFDEGCWSG
jgi:hypothetical protein